MSHGHTFWFLLTWICVVWYSTITIYVSIKGAFDIKQMLRDLRARGARTPETSSHRPEPK